MSRVPPSAVSKQMHDSIERQRQLLTPDQGHLITEVGHIAYQSMFCDETNTMRPRSGL